MKRKMIPPRWKHQEKALEIRKDRFCFFFDTGTGKTRTALDVYDSVKKAASKVIVISPINVCRNWAGEVKKFIGDVPCFIVAGGTAKQKKAAIEKFHATEGAAFLIVNTDTMRVPVLLGLIQKKKVPFIIVDEAHDFKTPTSARTRGLFAVVHHMRPKYLYLLTATPSPQGEIDLYTPMNLMGITTLPFVLWRNKHFVDVNQEAQQYLIRLHARVAPETPINVWRTFLLKTIRNTPSPLKEIWQKLTDEKLCKTSWFEWQLDMIDRLKSYSIFKPRAEAQAVFEHFLSNYSMTAKKTECMDLPPLVKMKVFAQMAPDQRRVYSNIEKQFYSDLISGGWLQAPNVLAQTIRLQQICAGIAGPEEIESGIDARLKALEYAISTMGDAQFLIWTIFSPSYKHIGNLLTRLGISHAFLTGEQSPTERFENMELFQAGKLRALIGHPKAGGVGVNLTAASFAVWYSKSFNMVDDAQSEGRNYRGGSERHERLTRMDILMENSMDERVHGALESKRSLQEFILDLRENSNGNGNSIAA